MPAPLSIDLRNRIMLAYKNGRPVKEIAQQFYVGQDSIYKLIRHVKKTGSVKPLPLNNGRKPKVSAAHLKAITERVTTQPDVKLADLINELELPIGMSALSKLIRYKLNLGGIRRRRYNRIRH